MIPQVRETRGFGGFGAPRLRAFSGLRYSDLETFQSKSKYRLGRNMGHAKWLGHPRPQKGFAVPGFEATSLGQRWLCNWKIAESLQKPLNPRSLHLKTMNPQRPRSLQTLTPKNCTEEPEIWDAIRHWAVLRSRVNAFLPSVRESWREVSRSIPGRDLARVVTLFVLSVLSRECCKDWRSTA